MAHRLEHKLLPPVVEKRVGADEQPIRPFAREGCEGCVNLAPVANVEDLDLQSNGACGFLIP